VLPICGRWRIRTGDRREPRGTQRAGEALLLGALSLVTLGCASTSDRPMAAPTTALAVTTVPAPEASLQAPPSTEATVRSTPQPTTAPAPPLAGFVVVLDPGHNEGNARHTAEINRLVDAVTLRKACDTTGTATDAGYSEAAFATDVAARVTIQLEALGARVVLTRDASTPWGPCIDERAAIGNDAGADVAVSIHADGGPASGSGFHVILPGAVPGSRPEVLDASAAFARALHRALLAAGQHPATYIGDGGFDTRTDLGGLNLSTVPKVLVETGNMRNADDVAFLSSADGRQQIADAISAAVVAHLTGPPR
jgi:N-acetylmuramoyl-L-alanine amidase